MSGANGSGVLGGVNGAARRVVVGDPANAACRWPGGCQASFSIGDDGLWHGKIGGIRAKAINWDVIRRVQEELCSMGDGKPSEVDRLAAELAKLKDEFAELAKLADLRGMELARFAVNHSTVAAECSDLNKRNGRQEITIRDCRKEINDLKAECCRLTDVNGDLARLRDVVGAVIRGFDGALKRNRPLILEAYSYNGKALRAAYEAITGEAKPSELTEADVIDPEWEPSQPTAGAVNARLLAAAKAVEESSRQNVTKPDRSGASWTGIDDETLDELLYAVNAAQGEGEADDAPEAPQPSDCGGVNGGQVIREQSERIKELEDELADAVDAITYLEKRNDALYQVSAAAAEFRAEYRTIPRNDWALHRAYKSLDFALDGLPKGGEAAKPELFTQLRDDEAIKAARKAIEDTLDGALFGKLIAMPKVGCPAPCDGKACQTRSQPCPERVHMLAVAARNLIVAHRRGRLSQCDVHTLDFALDGLI